MVLGNNKLKFIKFNIAEFYPSASEEPLDKAINYAKRSTDICDNVITAIKLARKLLFSMKNLPWVKKGQKDLCDNGKL